VPTTIQCNRPPVFTCYLQASLTAAGRSAR
jgi:hypothetical protein